MIEFIKILLTITIATVILLIFHNYSILVQTILILLCLCLYITHCFCEIVENENDLDNHIESIYNDDSDSDHDSESEHNQTPQIIIKINNLKDLNTNFSHECCICLDKIDPILAFKLPSCNYHIYHEDCLNLYLQNKFYKCPVCNI